MEEYSIAAQARIIANAVTLCSDFTRVAVFLIFCTNLYEIWFLVLLPFYLILFCRKISSFGNPRSVKVKPIKIEIIANTLAGSLFRLPLY